MHSQIDAPAASAHGMAQGHGRDECCRRRREDHNHGDRQSKHAHLLCMYVRISFDFKRSLIRKMASVQIVKRMRVLGAGILGTAAVALLCIDVQLRSGKGLELLDQPLSRSEPG